MNRICETHLCLDNLELWAQGGRGRRVCHGACSVPEAERHRDGSPQVSRQTPLYSKGCIASEVKAGVVMMGEQNGERQREEQVTPYGCWSRWISRFLVAGVSRVRAWVQLLQPRWIIQHREVNARNTTRGNHSSRLICEKWKSRAGGERRRYCLRCLTRAVELHEHLSRTKTKLSTGIRCHVTLVMVYLDSTPTLVHTKLASA